MRKALKEAIDRIDTFPRDVKAALMETRSDADVIDVIGTVKSVERRYKPLIRSATAEHAPGQGSSVVGELHRADTPRVTDRSYNTPRLMRKMQDNGITFMDLIEHGVIDVKWRWTDLERFARTRGIDLTIVGHEVTEMGANEDGDIGVTDGKAYPRWS